jgi:two-component system chemotaxis sensor kinase CheA
VIKSLETNYRKVNGVSGATIMGDGRVALIVDVPGVMRTGSGLANAA